MALISQQPIKDAYANLDLNDQEETGLEIDTNLVLNNAHDFRWALVGRLLGTANFNLKFFIS